MKRLRMTTPQMIARLRQRANEKAQGGDLETALWMRRVAAQWERDYLSGDLHANDRVFVPSLVPLGREERAAGVVT